MDLLVVHQLTSVCHVDVEDCDSEGKVILVEDSLKLGIKQFGTLSKAEPTPGVKRASLKLDN